MGDLEEGRVVGDGEGLQGRVGANPVRADCLEIGGIEGGEKRVGRTAVEDGVHRATVAVRSGAGLPALTVLGEGVDAGRLGREDAGSADHGGEEAAGAEGSVADDFGVEPKAALAREEEVAGIEGGKVGAGF